MRARIFGMVFAALSGAFQSAGAGPIEDGRAAMGRGDRATALQILGPVAEQGDAEAQFLFGKMHEFGDSQAAEEAVKWFQRAAQQGHLEAQYHLGYAYDNGWPYNLHPNYRPNYREASRWLQRAAERGHLESQLRLGSKYFSGEGAPQSYKEAAKWYLLAAGQEETSAMYALGGSYYFIGDFVRAHAWFNLAAALGVDYAKDDRDRLERKMTAAQLLQAQEVAQRCFARNYKECE